MRKLSAIALVICLCATRLVAQTPASLHPSDFLQLVGKWEGKLTYLDYSSHKPVSMPANVEIRQIGESAVYVFYNSYPKEPNANSTDTVTIGNKGTSINDERLISRKVLDDGSLELITEIHGIDGNEHKPARIKHTYTISSNLFRIRKEVLFDGAEQWLQRHEFLYTSRK